MRPQIIVIGVSYFPTALAACRRAFDLARATDAEVHLVYAIGDTDDQGMNVARRDAQMLADALKTASSTPAQVHVESGPAAAAILRVAAEADADLIVVGNRGLVVDGEFGNEVPAQVLKGATCSVLLIDTSSS